MGKVIVTKEVAEAIEEFIRDNVEVMRRSEDEAKAILVAEHCGQDWRRYEDGQYSELNNISTYKLMCALVNGYEVEQTSEEKLREYLSKYNHDFQHAHEYSSRYAHASGVRRGMSDTLDILGITIEGIND